MPVPSAKLTATGRAVQLGRRPATAEQKRRTVPLSPFLKRYGGKPPPGSVDYHTKAARSLGEMLGNDQVGNCVVAAELHGIGVWSANEPGGTEAVATTREALAQYQAICGPGDNGCYIPAVLDHFRDRGLTAAGTSRRMEGYVGVNPRDQLAMQYAVWLFGGAHLGVNWPADWMNIRAGFVLKPTSSRIVGGHAIAVTGYDSTGLKVSTWGIQGTLSWEALADARFVDEAYARLSDDWHDAAGMSAAGVNVTALRSALATVAAGGYPDIPDDPNPPNPNPPAPPVPGSWDWEFDRTFSAVGYALRVHLGVDLSKLSALTRNVSWFTVLADLTRLATAIYRKDWAGAAAAAEQLLRDLGFGVNPAALAQFGRALVTGAELSPLHDAGPPAAADKDAAAEKAVAESVKGS